MIEFKTKKELDEATFKDLIIRTKLHRQLNNDDKLQKMIENADFLYTAWDGEKVVGYVRGLSDYADMIYVADLGVDENYRHQGIGKGLLKLVDENLGKELHSVLLASEYAKDYYAKVGYIKDERGYIKNPQHLDKHDWTV